MNAQPKESEVKRRLLSRALSRRRRKAELSDVGSALHLDLNREFEEERHDVSVKYFLATLILFGMQCAFYSWIGQG